MITYRDATLEDIDYVIANLWERGKREGEKVGLTIEEIRAWLLSFCHDCLYVLIYKDKPLAITGANSSEGVHYTTFLATKEFKNAGMAITLFMSRFTRNRFKNLNMKRLELWSASDHPEAAKWFNIIGFHLDKIDQPFYKYLYVPKNLIARKE